MPGVGPSRPGHQTAAAGIRGGNPPRRLRSATPPRPPAARSPSGCDRRGKIATDQVVTPAAWNIDPQDATKVHGPMEQSFIGAPIRAPADPVKLGHVARSCDSCFVCAVRAFDGRTGGEPARVRSGVRG
ncbi:MAG: nickel-dependent hydrogenase large subunit [Planctomycetota bacterium]